MRSLSSFLMASSTLGLCLPLTLCFWPTPIGATLRMRTAMKSARLMDSSPLKDPTVELTRRRESKHPSPHQTRRLYVPYRNCKQVFDTPNAFRNPLSHARRRSQRLMVSAKIVVRDCQTNHRLVVRQPFDLFYPLA